MGVDEEPPMRLGLIFGDVLLLASGAALGRSELGANAVNGGQPRCMAAFISSGVAPVHAPHLLSQR
jgi:hypothetical protein